MSDMKITNPAATPEDGIEIAVRKHRVATRIMHAIVAIGFVTCLVTGGVLWFGFDADRGILAILHAILGLCFFVAPVIYIVFSFRNFSRFMGTVTSYNEDDAGWIKAPMGGYMDSFIRLFDKKWAGRRVPPQDKYNTGQKGAGIVLILCGLTLGVTGLLMWAGSGAGIFGAIKVDMGSGMLRLVYLIHLIACILGGLTFCVHFFLSAIYPKTRVEFFSMWGNGNADYAYTYHKHGKWLNELEVVEEHEGEGDAPDQRNI